MKKLLFLLLSIVLLATDMTAQVSIAPEAGLNLPNMTIKLTNPVNGGGTVSTGVRTSVTAGATVEYGFSNKIFLQSGLFYLDNGCKLTSGAFFHINSIEIPLSIIYKQGSEGGTRFFIGVGPYIADNISGRSDIYGPNKKLIFGTDSAADIKPIDWGLALNAGVLVPNGFYLRVRYQVGLTNLQPDGDSDNSIRTSAIGFTIGYYIIHKPVKKSKTGKKK